MAAGNNGGEAGLSYVLQDMTDGQTGMERASIRLKSAKLPDFTACPAGGQEFHAAMADMSNAQTDGIAALLQWQRIHVKREMDKNDSEAPTPDQAEFKTKWFTARGVAAMWPVALLAVAVIIYVILEYKTKGG
jgi:hypothetical protein